jgi:hypothetical protein
VLDNCPVCGKYTIDKPCYDCVSKERDKYKALAEADILTLQAELDKYKKLYEMAIKTCPGCLENCAVRSLRK